VACAEPEIAEAVEAAGGRAVLTRPDHGSGSDRIFEALEALDPEGRHDVVLNLQGDLPTIAPEVLRAVLAPLADPAVDIATLVAEITDPAERGDPNVPRAALVFSEPAPGMPVAALPIARALYFSRAAVPWDGGDPERPLYHHIGLYAYRRPALARFVALPASGLERRERLEQLRALEAGMRIDAALVDTVPLGVDTPADLARARELLGPRA
jgi:3-deoxy-manno-octulosonate cytidylyltransferase (CMP-KDO synthetase)